jgi:hypothetical protein
VAADRRHTYVLFQNSQGETVVVRGGPDARPQGNDLENFVGSTVLGHDNFGHVVVDAARYEPPYEAHFVRGPDGRIAPLPARDTDPADPRLIRDAQGHPIRETVVAPDWPQPGERHERAVVWSGTDVELERKLEAALRAGNQINAAKLEYSPLYNNSNGVASTVLTAAGVVPTLPRDADGQPVKAPNFGETLYQEVGAASSRSGYSFDGRRWRDHDGREIRPPVSGQPVQPLHPEAPTQRRGPSGSVSANDVADPALYAQIQRGVHGLDAMRGRMPDASSERMTMSLYALAREHGITRVDHVVLSQQGPNVRAGENVFIVQGGLHDATNRHAHLPTAQAIAMPVEQTLVRVANADEQRSRDLAQVAMAAQPTHAAYAHRV